ncbi:hypothetical protein AWRI1631_80120 [Saccharomyces cerevisiae AWRI1631]|uniref:Uncharacterized protein n=1 Tax=Saccharomyces cerevisiae (strain AWRI1631) TaxID=545124 RepID=B5VJP3_YEAS6|nr:hypothetical protein AWRI1631_80120 [Saccharomyces cerevisiae AWRI1631]
MESASVPKNSATSSLVALNGTLLIYKVSFDLSIWSNGIFSLFCPLKPPLAPPLPLNVPSASETSSVAASETSSKTSSASETASASETSSLHLAWSSSSLNMNFSVLNDFRVIILLDIIKINLGWELD